MQKLSFIIVLIFSVITGFAQKPHGEDFKIDCATCHNSESWKVTKPDMSFDHNTTKFKLTGQHQMVDCKSCHTTLKFQETKSECASCHTDMHQNTLGPDCAKCHDTKHWIVQNTTTMHQLSRFPLLGNHAVADCAQCHKSSSKLQFEPLGIECIDCHRNDYLAAKTPNHQQSGYSTNCMECHGVRAIGWNSTNFEHGFFPLTEGHSISCAECHKDGSYQKISNECVNCHQTDFNSTTKPSHIQTGFSTACAECHTTSPGWSPANYTQHDALDFPIYSGEHKGEWNKCTDCHTTNSYSTFSCINCHEHNQSDMDSEHRGTSGYSYKSISCYSCHPQGNKSGAFNHSTTSFPLTGAHTNTDCASCHKNGFTGTSSECNSCHLSNYNSASNPNHNTLGLPVTCADCHTSNPDWQPASFAIHNNYYVLTGAHATIAKDCATCHNGIYTNTQKNCYTCHTTDYNNTSNPKHATAQFSTECASCHSQSAWVPSTFNHDAQYFPIYSGKHQGKWTLCSECHTSTTNYSAFSCIICHEHNNKTSVDEDHNGVNGYAYNGTSCYTCHPKGDD